MDLEQKPSILAIAISIAADAHKDQRDKGGKPYILHPLRLAMRLNTDDEELMALAVLHDTIEDTKVTIDSLRSAGMTDRVLVALQLLTHDFKESYKDYVAKIATNYDALRVKMEDLKDNSDITRLKGVEERDIRRMEKYLKAYSFLREKRKEFENASKTA